MDPLQLPAPGRVLALALEAVEVQAHLLPLEQHHPVLSPDCPALHLEE